MKTVSQVRGQHAEDEACRYLEQHGLKCVGRNYHCRMGEIDLIMQDSKTLVFVEVRARSSSYFGRAEETITYTKQRKIIQTAMMYLTEKGLVNRCLTRFDVLCIQGQAREISWVKNAFEADGYGFDG
ncbi:MAG: YraN family protein [Legionellaceae bacterium]|nr:YraN family protein [Legionellaceae bacterium]